MSKHIDDYFSSIEDTQKKSRIPMPRWFSLKHYWVVDGPIDFIIIVSLGFSAIRVAAFFYLLNVVHNYFIFRIKDLKIGFLQCVIVKQRLLGFFVLLCLSVIFDMMVSGFMGLAAYVCFFFFSSLPLHTVSREYVQKHPEQVRKWDRAYFNQYSLYRCGFFELEILIGILMLFHRIDLLFHSLPAIVFCLLMINYRSFFSKHE